MEYRSKTSSGHQATQPLKLSRFENQQSKPSSSKPKPTCNTLFKQQILKDRQISKHSINSNNTYLDPYNRSFEQNINQVIIEEDNQYGKLLSKFNRNKSKCERAIDSENQFKSHTSSTVKIQPQRGEMSEGLNSSFRSNESRLKFLRKDESKPQSLSKCVSMNFLQALQMKNRKRTPPNRQPSHDQPRPALGPKIDNQLVKMIEQLRNKNILIKQLQNRQQQLMKQLGERNKFQVEYYKVLNNSILLQQDLRRKERRIEDLQAELLKSQKRICKLQNENLKYQQQFKGIDCKLAKQAQGQIIEWKRINQILSDSLIKLNQQNSLIAKRLSQLESKYNSTSNKLSESQKLVTMLKSNIDFEKNARQSLVQHYNSQTETLNQTIESLEKQKQTFIQTQKQLKQDNARILKENQQKRKSAQFYQQQSISLIEQIKQLNQRINKLNNDKTLKNKQIINLQQSIQQLKFKNKNIQNNKQLHQLDQLQSQQQELRQQLIFLKISHQEKQSKYQDTIRQHKDKILVLEEQIEQIKSITNQVCTSPNVPQNHIHLQSNESDQHKRQVLNLQTQIVQLRSRLEVFGIIERELRERLHLNAERMADLQNQNDIKLLSSQAMISTLKKRIQLLQKQLQIIGKLQSSSETAQDDDMLHKYVKQLLTKIRNMQDIINNIHIQNKKLEYQIKNKNQFIDQLKQQIQKDGDMIKQLKNAIEQTNKRLISHTLLLQLTNKSAIVQQLKFGNYKQQMEQNIQELKQENGSIGGELKGIYTKLEILEEKINEEDDEYIQSTEKDQFPSRVQFSRQRDFFYNIFIEQRKQKLSVLTLEFQ